MRTTSRFIRAICLTVGLLAIAPCAAENLFFKPASGTSVDVWVQTITEAQLRAIGLPQYLIFRSGFTVWVKTQNPATVAFRVKTTWRVEAQQFSIVTVCPREANPDRASGIPFSIPSAPAGESPSGTSTQMVFEVLYVEVEELTSYAPAVVFARN